MDLITLGGYASALSAVISVLVLLYRLFSGLEHLLTDIQLIAQTVTLLEEKQHQLEQELTRQAERLDITLQQLHRPIEGVKQG
ncbi:MAG: hypothetical protein Q4A55_02725 [Aerococcus sp.]|nr:hypothetical protein [Aerococcus sp.]